MTAVAARVEDPFEFYDTAMAAFDERLYADPAQASDVVMDRRIAELLEEAA